MRKSGMTYEQIGAALGISKGRVCQIVKAIERKAGGDNKSGSSPIS